MITFFSSGANFETHEADCISLFEAKLEQAGMLSKAEAKAVRARYAEELGDLARAVKEEPFPDGSTIWDHVFHGEPGRDPLA